jgi:polysaccharide export outer membrane protein
MNKSSTNTSPSATRKMVACLALSSIWLCSLSRAASSQPMTGETHYGQPGGTQRNQPGSTQPSQPQRQGGVLQNVASPNDGGREPSPYYDPLVNSVDPATYLLRPGDQLVVEVTGINPSRTNAYIDQSGVVTIYPGGPVKVSRATVRVAEGRIHLALSRYLKNFDVHLSLASLRRFQVQISGEVHRPGNYLASGMTGVSELLEQAGGLTSLASERRIRIVDRASGRLIRTVDLDRFLYLGDRSQDPSLFPNEAVMVPASAKRLEIEGQAGRPGKYEVVAGDTLSLVLQMAGGLTSRADSHSIQVGRLNDKGHRVAIKLDLADPNSQSFPLEDGDQIEIFDRSLNQSRVEVYGELNGRGVVESAQVRNVEGVGSLETTRQGAYYIPDGETLRELVLELGGPTAKADLEYTWVERRLPKSGVLSYYPVNLRKLLHNDTSGSKGDFVLQDGDRVVVPPLLNSVFVVGYVFHPGQFPYTPGFGLREYLSQSGGPTREASTNQGRVIRRVPGEQPEVFKVDYLKVLNGQADNTFDVRPGDVLFVPHYQPFYQDTVNILSSILPLFYYVKIANP